MITILQLLRLMRANIYRVPSVYQVLFQALKCNHSCTSHNFLVRQVFTDKAVESLRGKLTSLNSEGWEVINPRSNSYLSVAEQTPNHNVFPEILHSSNMCPHPPSSESSASHVRLPGMLLQRCHCFVLGTTAVLKTEISIVTPWQKVAYQSWLVH